MKRIVILLLFFASLCAAQQNIDTNPKFFGYVRAWHETDMTSHESGFVVKMARFGVRGAVNEYADYRIFTDFARLGSMSYSTSDINGKSYVTKISAKFSDVLLDAQATIKPFDNFSVSMGQFKVPFSTDNLRSGATVDFVNRPLITNVAPGLRDVGLMAAYKIKSVVPIELNAGLFNGAGQNKSETDKTQNYSLRAVVGALEGLDLSVNYYGGRISTSEVNIFDVGADYKTGNLFVTGEFGQRKSDLAGSETTSSSYFVYAYYNFKLDNSLFSSLMPAIRYENWDPNSSVDKNEVNRITAGLAFQFAKVYAAQLRINYEVFSYTADNVDNQNKLYIELQTKF